MKAKLILLTLLLSVQPALSNVPGADFLVQENNAGINIIGVSGTSPSDPKWHLDGATGMTSAQMAQALAHAKVFDWAVYPDPNPVAAAAAVQADQNIPIQVQVQLGSFAGVLGLYPYNPAGVQQYWTSLKQTQSSWLTADLSTAIENDCLTAFVVLNTANNPKNFHIAKPKTKTKPTANKVK